MNLLLTGGAVIGTERSRIWMFPSPAAVLFPLPPPFPRKVFP